MCSHTNYTRIFVHKGTSGSSEGTSGEKTKGSRRGSKVTIAETATDGTSRQGSIDETTNKKKSTGSSSGGGSSSVEKSSEKRLSVKATTEVRSPSPIPEDPVGEEASRQSTSSATSGQEKKVVEGDESRKEETQERHREKCGDTSEKDKSEEQKEDERAEDKDRSQQLENTPGNNGDNAKAESSKLDKENDGEKLNTEAIPESVPIQTTKLRGKSKATGRIMGGWI